MLVLVGLMVQMASNPIGFPTTIFFLFVSSIFVLAGILHPQELACLFCGFIYYLAIPSMYMLLNIYAIVNLHIVSWGTREVKQTPTEKKIEDLKKEEAERKMMEEVLKENKLMQSQASGDKSKLLPVLMSDGDEGVSFSCGNCFKVICCGTTDARERQFDRLCCEIEKLQNSIEASKMPEKVEKSLPELPDRRVKEVEKKIIQMEDASQADSACITPDKTG